MILYTEKQLEDAYHSYRVTQVKQDMAFITLQDFRIMFEQILHFCLCCLMGCLATTAGNVGNI